MGCPAPDNPEGFHSGNYFIHLAVRLVHQVKSSENRYDILAKSLLNLLQHPDNAGMRASGHHNQAVVRIKNQALFGNLKVELT